MADAIRIANCSGYFGDRADAAVEMVTGGSINVLTGDWLAELTMLILHRIRAKRPGQGYARTFVSQMEQVMGRCLDDDIRVVTNAGGLDPQACAEAVAEVAGRLGLAPTIAYVSGDDVTDRLDHLQPFTGRTLDIGEHVLTANAYLGCWGIVDALERGADIVITGRVTDAAVVCGPAAWHHGWKRTDFDQLAGAVAAGHIIECSGQATGGNYSFFTEIPDWDAGRARFGYPWAEIAADGSSLIGKHADTGGLVSVETVTSQLLYEIGSPRYLGPDVTARFDTVKLEQVEPDRVRVSGVLGETPPETLKVATNKLGGFRNSVTVGLVGLDIEEKAALCEAVFWDAYPHDADDLDDVSIELSRTDQRDPESNDAATARWTITVKSSDEELVGRAFSNAVTQTALASIPGMHLLSGPPSGARPFGVYVPAQIQRDLVPAHVGVLGAETVVVDSTLPASGPVTSDGEERVGAAEVLVAAVGNEESHERVPLGRIVGARSGDKGGDANLGVFVRSQRAWAWLDGFLTTERLQELLPEAAEFPIERYRFDNVWALNFVIVGLLGDGVAASTRPDAQAKSLGEWLRARVVPVPPELLND